MTWKTHRPPTLAEYAMAKKKLEPFDMKAELEKIEQEFDNLSERAVQIVLKSAREILINDPDLDEFIMAMGSYVFTVKEGGKYDGLAMDDDAFDEWCESPAYVREYKGMIDDENFQPEFRDMVDTLDEKYNVCGYPVRFKANTKEVHHWGDTRKNPVVYEELC